jgi:hypothetical protein
MPTLHEVDEALAHLAAVPKDQRGAAWHAYADAVLTERDFAKMTGDIPEEICHG